MNGHWYIMGSHGSCCSGGEKASYTVVSLVSTTDTPFGPYAYYNSNDIMPYIWMDSIKCP